MVKEGWRENVPMLYEYLLEQRYDAAAQLFNICWNTASNTPASKHQILYGTRNANTPRRPNDLITLANVRLPRNELEQWDNVQSHFQNRSSPTRRIKEAMSIQHPDRQLQAFGVLPSGGLVSAGHNQLYHYPSLNVSKQAHCSALVTPDTRPGPGLCVRVRSIVNGARDGRFMQYDLAQSRAPAACSNVPSTDPVLIQDVDAHPSDNWFCGVTRCGRLLIWDRRHQQVDVPLPVDTFEYHAKAVNCVRWSPHLPNVYAAASDDMSITLANVSKEPVGTTMDDTALFFRHFIHHAPVKRVAWHPQLRAVLTSVGAEGERRGSTVHVWKPNLWLAKSHVQ
ncbi:hypothetical protein THASP1DRAFT_30695 [Thamnocephalis sphaerospora]|uniref:WD40-repeat-containing domain protein n=1 Tax=Thamnocephalis sphaerospora TaxID=78915 RepID=A0A4V1IWG6_9FUNG|nr:hypothetical protein THASP1DRAFT_30695 [Thamnocephalis sphaerospora]|eukprot:RKP07489.1 hypothetical protein THASP1DRAFT_30695 [Thamnocephalis sphaerospora]